MGRGTGASAFGAVKRKRGRSMDELCMMGMLWVIIIGGALSVIVCDFLVQDRIKSFGGKVGLILYTGLALTVIYSYWVTITTPSYAPPDYVPPDCSEKDLDEGKRLAPSKEAAGVPDKFARAADSFDKVRYCTRCKSFKPPRSHHCKDCERCTLRLDHHCPWVGSCIGYYNHKCFVLFLFYAEIALVVSAGLHIVTIFQTLTSDTKDTSVTIVFQIIFSSIIAPFAIALLPLLFSQLSTVFTNETTLESSVNYRMSHRDKHFVNPYNIGRIENIRQFMGDSVWEWFIPRPLPRTAKAGLIYPVRKVEANAVV